MKKDIRNEKTILVPVDGMALPGGEVIKSFYIKAIKGAAIKCSLLEFFKIIDDENIKFNQCS